MKNILKLLIYNKKYDGWQTCKRCKGKVIFVMPKWYEEIFFGKMGTLKCTNCGVKQEVP